jgi:hypothetical protein
MKFIDITGNKYNRLTVIKRIGTSNNGQVRWLCQCDCGNYTEVSGGNLKNGSVKSCGCIVTENNKKRATHNMTNTRLYYIWCDIKNRCTNQNLECYKNYGGRGIEVCNEWKNNFLNFYNWAMQNDYQKNLTIDRINNDGNYEPNNCRWVTMQKQSYNRRDSYMITINNKTKCLAEWCKIYKIPYLTVYMRITKRGMKPYDALTKPIKEKYRNKLYRGNKNAKKEEK